MTKTEIIKATAERTGLSVEATQKTVNAFLDVVTDNAARGITLPGFGSFVVKDVPERTGRNPKTAEAIVIPAHRRAVFKAGKSFTDKI